MAAIQTTEKQNQIVFSGDERNLFEVINAIGSTAIREGALVQGTYSVNPNNTFVDASSWKKKFYPTARNLAGVAKKDGKSTNSLSTTFISFILKDSFLATEIAEFLSRFDNVEIQVQSDAPCIIINAHNQPDEVDEESLFASFLMESDALEHSAGQCQ